VKHISSGDSEFNETATADDPSMQLLVPVLIITAEFNLSKTYIHT
jgi:hypothetical protein